MFDPTAVTITGHYHAERRKSLARQEIISLQLRLATLLEPKQSNDEGEDGLMYWSERSFIEQRIAELRKVVDEEISE